jgi:hypothetical protein
MVNPTFPGGGEHDRAIDSRVSHVTSFSEIDAERAGIVALAVWRRPLHAPLLRVRVEVGNIIAKSRRSAGRVAQKAACGT